jgi:beta-glucanase (GH16 family)
MGRNVGRLGLAALLVLTGGLDAFSPRAAWPLTIDPVPVAPLASSGGLWLMTFADEFEGNEVDPEKWSNGFGWGDTAENFAAWCDPTANTVADGVLVQRADRLPAPQNGKGYSGACLHTKGTFSQLYGYWEARMKVAAGPGVHSAFWGKPANEPWPPELDVQEIGGDRPDTVIMSAHWRDETGHRLKNKRYKGPDNSLGFHVFGLEWSRAGATWYVDGVERARFTEATEALAAQGPFYALLNLQVGLGGAVQPSAATPFPAYQLVDYVRIWERPFGMVTFSWYVPELIGRFRRPATPLAASSSSP